MLMLVLVLALVLVLVLVQVQVLVLGKVLGKVRSRSGGGRQGERGRRDGSCGCWC